MMNKIIIVCSGMSAKGFTPPDDAVVIAVNGAIDWIIRADYWFTLDPSAENMARMENKRNGVIYCAAFNDSRLPVHRQYIREADFTATGIGGYSGTLGGKRGLSENESKIHTGNSAYGALGLAYHIGFSKVLFIGLDGTDVRVDGGRSRDLSHLNELFDSALPQVAGRVVNGSEKSLVNSFPKMNIENGLKWLSED